MKRAFILLTMPLLCLACDQIQKRETTETAPGTQVEAANTTAETAQKTTGPIEATAGNGQSTEKRVDGPASFNGIIMIPPKQHATITLTMGGSIESVAPLPGEYVRQGQVIATLRNPEFINLQQTYLDAKARAAYLEQEYERQKTLASREAASRKRFQQSEADYLSMRSQLDASAAQLMILGVDPKSLEREGIRPYLEIKAPLSGYVTNMSVNVGKYINVGEPICDVINKQEPLLLLTAYEKDLSRLSVGERLEFRVNGAGDERFEATLISIDEMVDETNRSIKVYARVGKANPRFRPGMYVSAKIQEKP